jgi:hypothetical protein
MATVDESVAGLSQTMMRLWFGRRDDSVFFELSEGKARSQKVADFLIRIMRQMKCKETMTDSC